MPVYMIRCGKHGPVKIGKADDPQARLCELQVAHWEKLSLLRSWHGDLAEEAMLHAKFSDLRIRGEWFSFSSVMLGNVGLAEVEAKVDETPAEILSKNFSHTGLVSFLGGNTRLAMAIGIRENAVAKWRIKGIPSAYWHRVVRLAELAGIPVTSDELEATKPTIVRRAIGNLNKRTDAFPSSQFVATCPNFRTSKDCM